MGNFIIYEIFRVISLEKEEIAVILVDDQELYRNTLLDC